MNIKTLEWLSTRSFASLVGLVAAKYGFFYEYSFFHYFLRFIYTPQYSYSWLFLLFYSPSHSTLRGHIVDINVNVLWHSVRCQK